MIVYKKEIMNFLKSAYLSENFKEDLFSVHVSIRVWKFLQGLNEEWKRVYVCFTPGVRKSTRLLEAYQTIGLNIQPNSQSINNFVNQSTDYSIDLLIKTSNIKMTNFSSIWK